MFIFYFPDGPFVDPGPSRIEAYLGDSVSLLAGTNFQGIPFPNILWRAPNRRVIVSNSSRYTLFNDRTAIRLNISEVNWIDVGTWSCVLSSLEYDERRGLLRSEVNINIHLTFPSELERRH